MINITVLSKDVRLKTVPQVEREQSSRKITKTLGEIRGSLNMGSRCLSGNQEKECLGLNKFSMNLLN